MAFSKESLARLLEADERVVSLRQLDPAQRDWVLDHYEHFNAAAQAVGLEAMLKSRLMRAIETAPLLPEAAGLWIDLALNAGAHTLFRARRVNPRIQRIVYGIFGSWPRALRESGNDGLALRLKANAGRRQLIERRFALRRALEARVASGAPISLRHDAEINRLYVALYRKGREGRRAIRAELSRVFAAYGARAYNPKRLPRQAVIRDEGPRLMGTLIEVASAWRDGAEPEGRTPCDACS